MPRKQITTTKKRESSNCIVEYAWGNVLFTMGYWTLTSKLRNGKEPLFNTDEFYSQANCQKCCWELMESHSELFTGIGNRKEFSGRQPKCQPQRRVLNTLAKENRVNWKSGKKRKTKPQRTPPWHATGQQSCTKRRLSNSACGCCDPWAKQCICFFLSWTSTKVTKGWAALALSSPGVQTFMVLLYPQPSTPKGQWIPNQSGRACWWPPARNNIKPEPHSVGPLRHSGWKWVHHNLELYRYRTSTTVTQLSSQASQLSLQLCDYDWGTVKNSRSLLTRVGKISTIPAKFNKAATFSGMDNFVRQLDH